MAAARVVQEGDDLLAPADHVAQFGPRIAAFLEVGVRREAHLVERVADGVGGDGRIAPLEEEGHHVVRALGQEALDRAEVVAQRPLPDDAEAMEDDGLAVVVMQLEMEDTDPVLELARDVVRLIRGSEVLVDVGVGTMRPGITDLQIIPLAELGASVALRGRRREGHPAGSSTPASGRPPVRARAARDRGDEEGPRRRQQPAALHAALVLRADRHRLRWILASRDGDRILRELRQAHRERDRHRHPLRGLS